MSRTIVMLDGALAARTALRFGKTYVVGRLWYFWYNCDQQCAFTYY